ncbi:unnamed protein product [Peronospora farinosa]|uniref:Ubiquitin-like protease family profile domain-containing protein n=1 Tax=Peronospora farinosa TaxID=134698 RepID=A0AAV0T5F4_9STRA|nr:unnamed protein product [Peronospora farinosa]
MADHRERHRRFGARRQPSAASNHRYYKSSGISHYSHTLELSTGLSDRSVVSPTSRPVYNYNNSWQDKHRQDFDFSRDRPKEEGYYPPKYTSNKPKASGQGISIPGSSIVTATPDSVLVKGFIPPKQQTDFLSNLTKKNTRTNRGPGLKSKMLAYSSLEAASGAISIKNDEFNPLQGSSGWVNMKVQEPVSIPRDALAPAEKKREKAAKLARKKSFPVVTPYALRDRSKPTLFSKFSTIATQSFDVRYRQVARLGKRKMNSEGSAAKPIALDSDSDSDTEAEAEAEEKVQSDSASNSMTIVDEVMNDTRNYTVEEKLEEKEAVVDWDDVALHANARMINGDVMIGLFQCIVDLFFQADRIYMGNIRGKYEIWPFKQFYLLEYKHLQDVRVYSATSEVDVSAEVEVREINCRRHLLEEVSFIAFKVPMPEATDQAAVKTFYDPSSPGFMVLLQLEDASGDSLGDITNIIGEHADVQLIDDKEQAMEHLQALMKDPFDYKLSRRTRRRKSDAARDTASESDEEDNCGDITVLTYPPPPCTNDIVTIVRHDVSRLKPRRYLNDNIIDYYFKRMILQTFQNNKLVQEKVLFLSSHFYSRLRAGMGSTTSERMEAGYKNVSTWLARSNLFSRSIIFIPINKDFHWSLAVIVNPGVAGTDPRDEEAFSCIAVLDPLGSYHRKAAIIRNLRAFLRMQWEKNLQEEYFSDIKAASVSEYEVDRVLTLNVDTPLQENSYDCGAYVLKFAEVILKNCLDLGLLAQNNGVISKDVTDNHLEALITSTAFSAEDITVTRQQIQHYIEVDAIEYQMRKKEKVSKT